MAIVHSQFCEDAFVCIMYGQCEIRNFTSVMRDGSRHGMGAEYRHELKFLCEESKLRILEEKIRHICRPDPHVGSDGKYVIRSLYFDTWDDRCFFENEAGVDCRKKYRIRLYNGNAEPVCLECKEALRGLKHKDVCLLTKEQCRQLMLRQPVRETLPEQELLRRFLAARSTQILLPKVIVEYTRTPYIYAVGNVRITFDRYIRSSSAVADFLKPRIPGRDIMAQDMHILEVKYDGMLPGAVRELLTAGQELMQTSFSKYALCRQYSMR